MPRQQRKSTGTRQGFRLLFLSAFFSIAVGLCPAQPRYVVCENGFGKFETTFVTGVSVTVGATKSGGLAERSCSGSLAWDGHELSVAEGVAQVDIDVLGVDPGLGTPVVAFQVRQSAADWGMTYFVYSLKKPPRLLRTIKGGDFFRAADTDFNGQIEIWAGDADAINGFEGFLPGEFDFLPNVALRFEHNHLKDVSEEFQSRYDDQIAEAQARLNAQDLSNFRGSDGKLAATASLTLDRIHRLRKTKISILEIVWSYLYSGRDQDAWRTLASMWPPADFDRIQAAILNARARGIRSQIDGLGTERSRFHVNKHAYVFDAITEPRNGPEGHFPFVDTRPQAFLLRRPPPPDTQNSPTLSEQTVVLVIDAAGKVWSVESVGNSDKDLIDAAAGWKFIPAFVNGHAVASRLRMSLSPDQ